MEILELFSLWNKLPAWLSCESVWWLADTRTRPLIIQPVNIVQGWTVTHSLCLNVAPVRTFRLTATVPACSVESRKVYGDNPRKFWDFSLEHFSSKWATFHAGISSYSSSTRIEKFQERCEFRKLNLSVFLWFTLRFVSVCMCMWTVTTVPLLRSDAVALLWTALWFTKWLIRHLLYLKNG